MDGLARFAPVPALVLLLGGCFNTEGLEPLDTDTGDGSSGSTAAGVETSEPLTGGDTGMTGLDGTAADDAPQDGSASDDGDDTGTDDDGTDDDDGTSTGGVRSPQSPCESVYSDWFESSFTYPDGMVGPADFPSTPWGTAAGQPIVLDEALAALGDSVAVASQGAVFPTAGLRLRSRIVFNAESNGVTIGGNANANGDASFAVRLDASDGTFAALDDGMDIGSVVLGALELDVPYFVQLEFEGVDATAYLSQGNYATVPGATVVAQLDLADLGSANLGRYVSVAIEPGANSPTVDDLTLARCGETTVDYTDVFRDEFERETLGNADFPVTSAWNPHSATVAMIGGRVQLSGGFTLGIRAKAANAIGTDHARLRAAVRFGTSNAWPRVMWGLAGTPQAGESSSGFILYNNGDQARVILLGNGGGFEAPFDGQTFATATDYFVEVDIDGPFGVATVRTSSFTGPVVMVVSANDIASAPAGLDEVGIGNSGGGTLQVEEMALCQYTPNL